MKLGLINKIFGKSKKVKVYFIDSSTEDVLGVSEMLPEQLPNTFDVQTTMHINGEDWTVIEAIPSHSSEFIKSKELVLKMSKLQYMNPNDILFTMPTISNELPQTITSPQDKNDYEYSLVEDDWRQNEFLNRSSIPQIEIEFKIIQEIKLNGKDVDSKFTAFENCHPRDTIGEPHLKIDLHEFKELLEIEAFGNLKFEKEYIKNGFALKTKATTFYGIVVQGRITHLCVNELSDKTSDEIQIIANYYNLLYVSWYHCEIIESDD